MKDLLHNPVFNALLSGDKGFNIGTADVKFFDEEVSPFVGFDENYTNGFADLYDLLPHGRKILYATPSSLWPHDGWDLQHEIKGLQFVYEGGEEISTEFENVVPLDDRHIQQMVQLAALTKPGPFNNRTIEFGSYYGIFDAGKLVAMTGQRLHVQTFTEISAVCTHPNYTGKGYAKKLLLHQLKIILKDGQLPFLHVREDNDRAIELYKRLGFHVSRLMNFYFMKRR